MRVYRVQHEETESGPYGGYPSISRYSEWGMKRLSLGEAHADDAHPNPREDQARTLTGKPVFMYPDEWEYQTIWDKTSREDDAWGEEVSHADRLCGVLTLTGLCHWFNGWWDVLAAGGYIITEWDVPDEYVGIGRSGQVVFARNKAARIS